MDRSFGFLSPLAAKAFVIGLLTLLLLIPLARVSALIRERQGLRMQAVERVQAAWGQRQAIGAAIIEVPVDVTVRGAEGEGVRRHVERILADRVRIEAEAVPSVRRSGLHQVPVYQARVRLSGSFAGQDLAQHLPPAPDRTYRLEEARLFLPLCDARFLRSVEIRIDGSPSRAPGPASYAGLAGLEVPMPLAGVAPGQDRSFSADLTIAGSERLAFVPLARSTEVRLRSSWPHPSFDGAFLPADPDTGPQGFAATWQVHALNRSYPQAWRDQEVDNAALLGSSFGVLLYQPVDVYQRNHRAVHYAVLVIALTFLCLFAWEHLAAVRLHAVHYLLLGLALSVFYVLLVALSEHLEFALAYGLATGALVGLVGLYLAGVLRSRVRGLAAASALAGTYATLYLVLVSEDYALLLGALFLFAALAVVMLGTRGLDWSTAGRRSREATEG